MIRVMDAKKVPKNKYRYTVNVAVYDRTNFVVPLLDTKLR
jgi:hypothetical protein